MYSNGILSLNIPFLPVMKAVGLVAVDGDKTDGLWLSLHPGYSFGRRITLSKFPIAKTPFIFKSEGLDGDCSNILLNIYFMEKSQIDKLVARVVIRCRNA